MEKKITVKNIPKKNLTKDSKEKEVALQKNAIKAVRSRRLINFSLSFILLILFLFTVAVIYVNTSGVTVSDKTPKIIVDFIEINNNIFPKPKNLAAVVNNEEITLKELDERYALLPAEYQAVISKEDVLSQMIDETILMQQAKKENLDATDDEVNAFIDMILDQNQITLDEFISVISTNGLTLDEVKAFYKKEIVLEKLIDAEIASQVSVEETDIINYYEDNIDLFTVPEAINVSHILICHNESLRCVSNLSKQDAFDLAEFVYSKTDNEDFGELASEYSQEPGADISKGNIGWIMREDPYDMTFMDAAFALDDGQISEPVETVFGYHIIKVNGVKESQVIGLDEVKEDINQTISLEYQKELFSEYMSNLRQNSKIFQFNITG